MYLEISGRCTGKTTRLVEEANKLYLVGDKHVVVVVPYKHNLTGLHPDIPVIADLDEYLLENSLKVNQLRLLYDEFDLMTKVEIQPFGYYVTTPVKMRDKDATSYGNKSDPLSELLAANNKKFVRYTWDAKMSKGDVAE